MLDDTKIKELLDVYDEVYETYVETKDIVSGARERIKQSKVMMKDWAERNEINPNTIRKVYTDYKEWRDGKVKWGDEQEADDYTAVLLAVMDKAVEPVKE